MKKTNTALLEMVLKMNNKKAYTVYPMNTFEGSEIQEQFNNESLEESDYGFNVEDEYYNINENGELRSYYDNAIEELVEDYQEDIMSDYMKFTLEDK